jgi:hypothetical protein
MATYMCRFRVTRGVAEWMRKSTAIVLLLGAAQGAFGEEKPYSAVVSPNNSFDMWLLRGTNRRCV